MRRLHRSKLLGTLAAIAAGAAALAASSYAHSPGAGARTAQSELSGKSTLDTTITGTDPARGFSFVRPAPGEDYFVREDLGKAEAGRSNRRFSVVYTGQITDFQLADEESPAREERFDGDPFQRATNSGHRAQEALVAQQVEASVRQMNNFLSSPVKQGDGTRARLLNAVMTGDLADNMQKNETEWVVRLLEGGTLDPNSGTKDLSGTTCAAGGGAGIADFDDPRKYTGVQDYDDYTNDNPNFYDPNQPVGFYAGWPRYPGLLDRAQVPFQAEGLKVPSYIAFGNHDALYQGTVQTLPTVPPHPPFERVALGCVKTVFPFSTTDTIFGHVTPEFLAGLVTSDPGKVMLVPPDPNRQFVDKPQFRAIGKGRQGDGHGFGHVDPAEARASNNSASYYSFSPKRGVRYIVLDTVSEAGAIVGPASSGEIYSSGSDGNIDDPQWRWLQRELSKAVAADELVVAFGHHARTSLTNAQPDEIAPCTGPTDEHGHDTNPSCDRDLRSSAPLHFGNDLIDLFNRHPHVVAYVAGHSHENRVAGYKKGSGAVWEIKSPAVADWPPQHRMIEVMDNSDGTLSIFGTMLDHDSPVGSPASGAGAGGMGVDTLASIGRTITWNDPQRRPAGPYGERKDRNVELLLNDPRRNPLRPGGRRCANVRGKLSGKRLHRVRLRQARKKVRKAYARTRRKTRGKFDYFCLSDGRLLRVGYPGRGVRKMLTRRQRRKLHGHALELLTSSRRYAIRRIRPGSSVRTLRRRLRKERRFRIGRNTYYLANGSKARLLFRTQKGRVRAVGLADKRLTRGRRKARRFLRGFKP